MLVLLSPDGEVNYPVHSYVKQENSYFCNVVLVRISFGWSVSKQWKNPRKQVALHSNVNNHEQTFSGIFNFISPREVRCTTSKS